MNKDKPIICDVNIRGIIIKYPSGSTKTFTFNNQGPLKELEKKFTIRDVARSALPQLENPDLLDDETVLKIMEKILENLKKRIGAKTKHEIETQCAELAETISKNKEMIKEPKKKKIETQEKQSENEGDYTTNENTLYQLINKGNYDACAMMLKSLETEKGEVFLDNFLDNLLRQRNGYIKCIEILLRFEEFKLEEEEIRKIISELNTMIPEDTRSIISLEELKTKLSRAKEIVWNSEISEQDSTSEEVLGEEFEEENYEEFIANINLEDFLSENPNRDAIIKGIEIERFIEYNKEKNIDEEQEENEESYQDKNEDNNENEQIELEEIHQTEQNEDMGIEGDEDKDTYLEQLQSNVNQLMEELEQLNKQIVEIDEEIKKCDNAIQYYSRASSLKTTRDEINEIEDQIILGNLSDDQEKKLEQLKQEKAKLIKKLGLLRSNSTIPEFRTVHDLEKFHKSKVIRKDDLEIEAEELKTKRDEIARRIDEIEGEIAEIIGITAEEEKQNSERL